MRMSFRHQITGLGSESGSENLEASIQAHLLLLFNTRRYSVPYLPDYGLPDIHETFQGNLAAQDELAESIRQVLQKFEPRLKDVTVKRLPDPEQKARLNFAVEGKIIDGSRESKLSFQTQVQRDGRYTTTKDVRYG